MRPSDLLDASTYSVTVMRGTASRDWSRRAGTLDWDVAFTVTHIAGAITKYAMYLAASATSWSPLVISHDARATNEQLLDGIEISIRGLAFVASNVDSSVRGFHAWGMSDASASLARAANEVLVHGWDIATGLDVPYDPPPELCTPVLARMFPWLETETDPWTTLLAANGRTGGSGCVPLEIPLEEWDGTPPSGGRPPAIAWTWDPDARHWVPTYP